MHKKLLVLPLIVMFIATGCAGMKHRSKCILTGAAAGAAIGAGSGAIIDHQGDNDTKDNGAIIGAAAGAVIGGVVGCFWCKEIDTDGDGVPDKLDKCPNTPLGTAVDADGCPLDSDGDGVPDNRDKCPDTPRGIKVDANGCARDSDGDGVPDDRDKCPDTPRGTTVDADGCALDSDGDGVPDNRDKCPDTPTGVTVDTNGCPVDSDGDGVPDHADACPDTPKGATVDKKGCWALKGIILFGFDSAALKPAAYPLLDEAVTILKKNPGIMIEIQGHTDNIGPEAYNLKLSERRAQAVKSYLEQKGIASSRLTSKGYGEAEPVAANDTEEGRQENRRVRVKVVK